MSLLAGLLILIAVVAFGSVIPVVPTGAAVSTAALLANAEDVVQLALVVACGAAGAYLGDMITYTVLRKFGEPLAQRVGWLQRDDPQAALARIRERIEEHEFRTLLASRLIPGGRIPVLLAAALGGYPLRRFASAAVFATALWAVVYAAIGILGDTIFPDEKIALIVVVTTALLLSVTTSLVQRLVGRHREAHA